MFVSNKYNVKQLMETQFVLHTYLSLAKKQKVDPFYVSII